MTDRSKRSKEDDAGWEKGAEVIKKDNAVHYKMLETNPIYALEFAMDIFREEMSCYLPRIPEYEERKEPTKEIIIIKPLAKKQMAEIQQLQGEVKYIEKKLLKHISEEEKFNYY